MNIEEITHDDMVHSVTSLSYASKNLEEACQSLSLKAVGKCLTKIRIAITEVFSVYSMVALKSQNEMEKQE